MGITNFIKRVSDATEEIKEAITRKGVVVSECDSLEDMPDRIDEINTQGGGGTSVYTFLVFTSSKNTPSSPTGGSLSEDLQFTYPSNWSDGSGLTSDIWVSYADFTTNGIVGNWHTPVKMSGSSSSSSVDLSDYALKSWVLEQIKESIKPGGVIDLSKYATKEYVDQKISEIDPSGGTGIYVKSINGSTGTITFNGDGVSQSGNTFTFNAGSGSGTTTSINGETGALTFTGDGVSQSGKTFTFSGGGTSGGGVTKDYVDTQDASTLKSAKDYADGLVKTSGVSSLNELTGAVTISEGTNVTIIKNGNDLKISASGSGGSGEPGEPGESYITAQLFTAHSSGDDNDPPSVPEANSAYDTDTQTVINPPSGWAASATKTETKKYIWTIWGTFAESTGNQVGSWTTPVCLTGPDGPKGEDGDEIEEVYSLSNVSSRPTISSTSADSSGKTKSEDGYLPIFIFTDGQKEAVAERPSVSETNLYLFATKRRKHDGTWLEFQTPYMVANFVKAGLSDEDKQQIITEVTKDISSDLNDTEQKLGAIESRIDSIDYTDAQFIKDPDNALIKAITQYKTDNSASFSDLVINGQEAKIEALAGAKINEKLTGDSIKTTLSGAGIDLDGMSAKIESYAVYETKIDGLTTEMNSAKETIDGQNARITEIATNTYTKRETDGELTKVTNAAYQKIDAKAAEIASTVATSKWVWGVYDNDDSPTKILATKEYDVSAFTPYIDSDGILHKATQTEDEYRGKIEGTDWEEDTQTPKRKWTRMAQATALSTIAQQPGKIDLSAMDENSLARIVLDATTEGGEVFFDADTVNFKEGSKINAENLVLTNLTVTGNPEENTENPTYGADINYATINKCKINSCEIASQIKSKNYNGDPEKGKKVGFLFDAASKDGEFAIYYNPDSETDDANLLEISSSNIQLPAAKITGKLTANQIDASTLRVNAANIDGELIATKIKANSITVNELNAGNILNWLNGAIEVSSLRTISNSGTVTIKENAISLTDKNNKQALTVSGDDIAGITSPVSKNLTFTGGLTLDTWNAATDLNNSYTATKTFTGYTSSAIFSDAANQGLRINALPFYFEPTISPTVSGGNDPDNLDGTYDVTISLYANDTLVRYQTKTYHTWYSSTYGKFILAEMYGGEPVDSTLIFSSSFISARGTSVNIKYGIKVVASFQMDSGQSLQDFIVGGTVNVLTTSGKNTIQATTVGTANGASIGANGMIFAQDGEHYIQILDNKVSMIAGKNAIELSDSSFRMRINSTWYTASRDSSGYLKLS